MTLPLPLELPILPAPRERALLVLMNPDASMEAYLSVVEGDPSLTAAVLRAANSAMSWPSRPIRSANEGVVRLGTSAVRHLITATLVRSQFSSLEVAGVDGDELWRHLLACAVLCEAQVEQPAERAEAFTLGLLHDLGRLAMAAQAPTRYREVVNAAQNSLSARAAERVQFGITHEEFGQRISERWRLPEETARAIGDHHRGDTGAELGDEEEPPAPGDDMQSHLALARWIVRGLGIGDGVHRPERRHPLAEGHPLIESLGGRSGLMESIRWFRDSTRGWTHEKQPDGPRNP